MLRSLVVIALLCAVVGSFTAKKGKITENLRDAHNVHPQVRQMASGSNFMFAIINSHIKDNDTTYTENITLTITNYDASTTAVVKINSNLANFAPGTLNVAPMATSTFSLPPQIQTDYRDVYVGRYLFENKSLTVTANTQISVVVSNAHSDGLSEDDYVIYPLCTLGMVYHTVADESTSKGAPSTNIYSIVGTQDGTNVQLSPSFGLPSTLSLNAGQVLTLAAQFVGMSNVKITASKPVAVTTGAVCGFGYTNPIMCNHEALMLQPVTDIGLTVPYTKFAHEDAGELMVYALEPNTKLYLDTEYFDTITASEYYVLYNVKRSLLITADKGIYAVAVSTTSYKGEGSPFLAHLPSVNRFTKQSPIKVTSGLVGRVDGPIHRIRIQTALSNAGKIQVDGWTISGLFYERQGRSDYYVADFKVPNGTHTVTTTDPSVAYSVTMYGHTWFTAYAYTPGIDLPTNGGAC